MAETAGLIGEPPVTWVLPRRLRRKRYRIAVLGAQRSGKTTLISAWRNQWPGDEVDQGRTQSPRFYQYTKLDIDGTRLTIVKLADVPGVRDAWHTWETEVSDSTYVLYLIDARDLPELMDRKSRGWYRAQDDAGLLGNWLSDGGADLCVVVITHTDQDERSNRLDQEEYRDHLKDLADPIVLKLGGPRMVRIVVGSLKTEADARKATSEVIRHIVSLKTGSRND